MTAPVKKRPRRDPGTASTPDNAHGSTSSTPLTSFLESCKERHQQATLGLTETVDAMEESSEGATAALVARASSYLLALKGLQRDVLEQLDSTRVILKEKQVQLQRQATLLQNLQYEQNYIQQRIQTDVQTPQLDRMCQQAVQQPAEKEPSQQQKLSSVATAGKRKKRKSRADTKETNQDNSTSATTTSTAALQEAKNLVLCGSVSTPFDDPSQHEQIIATLHKEIHSRGTLERDANQATQDVQDLQTKLAKTHDFLQDLPKKLGLMERASLPLQNFFSEAPSKNRKVPMMIGSERKKRLDLAQSLSSPLYALFVQLQSFLDSSEEEEEILNDMSLEVIETKHASSKTHLNKEEELVRPDAHVIHWHIPLPRIHDHARTSSNASKRPKVTIEFYHLPKLNIVTAKATASHAKDKVDLRSLLVQLFPGDAGDVTWTAEHVVAMQQYDLQHTKLPGRPYHWCNYLAGNHLVPPDARQEHRAPLQLSTKVVVHTLVRRLRANVTLTYLLHTLEQRKPHPVPLHPAMEEELSSSLREPAVTARLVGWAETDRHGGSSNSSSYPLERSFLAVVRRKTASLKATVTVDPVRYPAVPPKWCLVKGGETSYGEKHGMISSLETGTTPLYDPTLGDMERILHTEFETLVRPHEEETYDWILAHQLAKLLQLWDASQRAIEEGSA